ncbi:hypothetical protein GCM10023085_79160 [Actinomadura viridis]|uniref:Uncharacterized protein n=1 Tax=Actinomadura viridis TaxID=58110 RepID=A0A931DTU6_9ACTN|nr:hypothetical protein [Actinomadura viridis]MBG6093435.1 hypothetical protein [Actinomadura viridis]
MAGRPATAYRRVAVPSSGGRRAVRAGARARRNARARFEPPVRPNKLGPVNRAPHWLLPTVLTALILAVVIGALLG